MVDNLEHVTDDLTGSYPKQYSNYGMYRSSTSELHVLTLA
jgi:hypothetical protein